MSHNRTDPIPGGVEAQVRIAAADDRSLLLQQLAQAEAHIAEGDQHIAKQHEIIAALDRHGHEDAADRARDFLRVLLENQAGLERYRQSILNRLHK